MLTPATAAAAKIGKRREEKYPALFFFFFQEQERAKVDRGERVKKECSHFQVNDKKKEEKAENLNP